MRGTALGACVALVDLPLRMAGALAGGVRGPRGGLFIGGISCLLAILILICDMK